MFVDLLAMCEEFETRVRLLEAKADECQNKTKKVVDEHSKIWENISKNLEKEVMAIEKPASLCERAEKLEENMNQFESRLKQLENRKSQSTVAGEVDLIEPLGEYEKNMNQQRADVEPMPFIFAQPVVLPSQSPTPVAPNHPRASQGPPMVFYPQQQALCSPPSEESFGVGPPMVQAMDVIGEEDFKVVVGRDGTTLDGIRMCSQVGPTSSQPHFFT